jgi:YVTN family beta-propeller protein
MMLVAAGLVLVGAKLSVRSVATGQALVPILGAPSLGPANTPTATPGAQRVRLRVQVVDDAGQPVPEAIVEVRDRFNGVAGQQETGAAGEAILGVKPDNGYVVIARKAGLPLGRLEGVDVVLPLVGPVAPAPAGAPATPTPAPFRGQLVQVRLGPAQGVAAGAPAAPGAPAVPAAPSLAASPRLFVGHSSPRMSAVDASSNLLLKHSEALGQGRMTLFGVSRDQSRIFAAWFSATEMLVLNAFDLSVERQVSLNSGGITSLSVNPQNGRVWVATLAPDSPEAGLLHELDPGGSEVLRRIPLPQNVTNIRFRPDGSILYLPNRTGSSLGLFDPVAGQLTANTRLPQSPTTVTPSPDGSHLYLVNLGSSRLLELDAASGEVTRALEVGTGSSAVAAHPDGKRLFVANQSLGFVQVVDLDSGQMGDLIPVGRAPMAVTLNADGSGLYVANAGSASVSLIDLTTNTVRETLNIGGNPATLTLVRPNSG